MKKFILGFIVGALLFSIIIPVCASIQQYTLNLSDCKLVIDKTDFNFVDMPMLNYKGYNYIPAAAFRSICDKLKIGFEFDNATKEIRIDTEIKAIEREGNSVSVDKTQESTIDTIPVYEFDGKKYVTYRNINNILNCEKYERYSFSFKRDLIAFFSYFPIDAIPEIIVDDIQCKRFEGNNNIFVDYDIWINEIAPVLKGE